MDVYLLPEKIQELVACFLNINNLVKLLGSCWMFRNMLNQHFVKHILINNDFIVINLE